MVWSGASWRRALKLLTCRRGQTVKRTYSARVVNDMRLTKLKNGAQSHRLEVTFGVALPLASPMLDVILFLSDRMAC